VAGPEADPRRVDDPAIRRTRGRWKRPVLEGRFIWLTICALHRGLNVVLDFGVWTKDERSALRFLASSVGASCELVYLEIDEAEQRQRRDVRFSVEPLTTFPMSDDDLRGFRRQFEVADEAELRSSETGSPPPGHSSWSSWVSERWPTSLPERRSMDCTVWHSPESA
jgi:AAA domain